MVSDITIFSKTSSGDLLIIPLIIHCEIIYYSKINRLSKDKYRIIAKDLLIVFLIKDCFKGFLITNLSTKKLSILQNPGFSFIDRTNQLCIRNAKLLDCKGFSVLGKFSTKDCSERFLIAGLNIRELNILQNPGFFLLIGLNNFAFLMQNY